MIWAVAASSSRGADEAAEGGGSALDGGATRLSSSSSIDAADEQGRGADEIEALLL